MNGRGAMAGAARHGNDHGRKGNRGLVDKAAHPK